MFASFVSVYPGLTIRLEKSGGRQGKEQTYESVDLGLLEVVAPVERIVPGIEEELRPFRVSYYHTIGGHSPCILRDHKVNIVGFERLVRMDDAIRKSDRLVAHHQLVELPGSQYILMQGDLGIHDEGILVEEPDVLAVGKLVQGVPHSDHFGPGHS